MRFRSLAEAPREGEEALVVWSEQGMGDVIQFCRYLHLLRGSLDYICLSNQALPGVSR